MKSIVRTLKRIPGFKPLFAWLLDLQLLLLTMVGYVPSHDFRIFCYRLCRITIGQRVAFHWRARFFYPRGISVGAHTSIGNDAFLDGRMGLTIGSCVNISGDVSIYTLEHDIDDPEFGPKGGPVVIEDYAYIATRATILPGVRIGRGAVVACGAVVTKDVPAYTLVGGVPAKFIRKRSEYLTYKLGYRTRFQ